MKKDQRREPTEWDIIDELHGTGFITEEERELGLDELLGRGIITPEILRKTKRGL